MFSRGKPIMTNSRQPTVIRSITGLVQQVGRYISGAVARIFGPNDDDYPKTGVQPFEGESKSSQQK
jgi:hypothetical protein